MAARLETVVLWSIVMSAVLSPARADQPLGVRPRGCWGECRRALDEISRQQWLEWQDRNAAERRKAAQPRPRSDDKR